uniref:ATPase family AAA domain containing 5 n=1 Tax=Naja naja TaxID=35670 RepID=A0A8C6VI96_NAJNA
MTFAFYCTYSYALSLQSCTKQKEDNLSIKAITNYFSPLGKNVESVLSPPKSNNIMDYFKKPPINENAPLSLLEQESKANSLSLENSSKRPSKLKWRGKRNNLNNKLKTDKTFEPLVDKDNDKETPNPQEENCKASFMSHSDVALISLTNGEETINVCSEGCINKVSYNNEERKTKIEGNVVKSNAKKLKRKKPKNEMELFENSTTETLRKDSHKETNKQIVSVTESENNTAVLTLDPEASAQMTPHNTVTVSFEDFLKSQGEHIEQIPREKTPDDFVASEKANVDQDSQDLPLKKVTVLAQIHSVPPKSLRSQKIASIFVNQKSKAKVKKCPASSEREYIEQVTQKRKSNVVIAEEELELAILESASSETVKSKCTAEERYQFMKAFRQPGADIVKNVAKRGPTKQKEVEEKPSGHTLEGEECEDDSNQQTANNALRASGGGAAHDTTEKCDSTRDNTTEKERELSQKSKGLRRHCGQKRSQSTPEKAMVSQTITENPPDACPLQTSTPKTNRSFKNDLYTAEVITEPFDSNSPIRMKFTRINTSDRFAKEKHGLERVHVTMNSTSRNIFKAKKLVEKAKAVQHNRISKTVEDALHVSLRRSSRQRALAEKKHLEKIENSQALDSGTVSDHIENPKKLQSVNDVLGKKTKFVKATKNCCVLKLFLVVIFISEDESENSQDYTEFKAKREFLMSGLPESLKKKIAKKAAVLEVYSAANSCFQKVIHVQQKDDSEVVIDTFNTLNTPEIKERYMRHLKMNNFIFMTTDFASEDMLWTEKYQPQNSSELIGNIEAIKKLHRWLYEWKRKASWEENRTQKEKKNDSSEHLDFVDETSVSDEENVLCNTMLLVGPPGIGKTAAVYACAQELGFKIFEVNASCQRSGRQILSQLKEATQSHQVNKQGVHAHKPCFFNHYSSTKSPSKIFLLLPFLQALERKDSAIKIVI